MLFGGSVCRYSHYDNWVKHHCELDKKLASPYTGGNSQEHKPIKLYEGPNPRSRFQEFHVDHKVKAEDLLNLGLRQHGIDPDIDARKGQYYLTEMTYKEKVRVALGLAVGRGRLGQGRVPASAALLGVRGEWGLAVCWCGVGVVWVGGAYHHHNAHITMSALRAQVSNPALSPGAKPKARTSAFADARIPHGFSSGKLVSLSSITLPPSSPKLEANTADVKRYGKEEAEEIARQQTVSFIGVVNKTVKPKTSVSKMRKKVLKNEKKGGTKTAFFIRSVDHDRIVKEGGMVLKIFVGPDVLGSAPFKFYRAGLSNSVENVLAWAKRDLRIHEPLDDLYIEQVWLHIAAVAIVPGLVALLR